MTIATAPAQSQQLLLDVTNTTLTVTPEQFDILCIDNPDLRLELTRNRELIVMPPTGGETGEKNGTLFARVWNWNDLTKLGRAFDSSTGYDFIAIGGGKVSPDVSWIEKSRLEGIDIKGFIPVVPDFVIELRSATDRLNAVKTKMIEYQSLGVKLGLLVNPQDRPLGATHAEETSARLHPQVEIYRLERELEVLAAPMSVNCNDVMPGLTLNLSEIW